MSADWEGVLTRGVLTRANFIFPPFNLASGLPVRCRRHLDPGNEASGILILRPHELEVDDGVNDDDDHGQNDDDDDHQSNDDDNSPVGATIAPPVERPRTRSVTRSTVAVPSASPKKALRSKNYSRVHRARASAAQDHRLPMYHYHSNTRFGKKYRDIATAAFEMHVQDLPHNEAGSFTGKMEKSEEKDRRVWTFRMLKHHKFRIIPWDGRHVVLFPPFLSLMWLYYHPRKPNLLTDPNDIIMVTLVGCPEDRTPGEWDGVMSRCVVCMDKVNVMLAGKTKPNRRGDFVALASGVSYGGGQKVRSCIYVSLMYDY